MKWSITLLLFFVSSLSLIPTSPAAELDLGYNNRYISEGRNQLTSGGIFWISGSQEIDSNISIGAAYGIALESRAQYDELNLFVEYANIVAGFEYSLAYTHLVFLKDNEGDNEISVGLAYTENAIITPFANFVYSTQVNGFFAEFGGEKEFILNENLFFKPRISLAYDYGYAGSVQDGYNHTAVGASLSYSVSPHLAITGIVEKSFGGSIINKETGKADHFWSGFHITYSW